MIEGSWKIRALVASRPDPLMAGIVRVMIGRPAYSRDERGRIVPGVLPGFGPKFRITEDGLIVGIQVNANGDIRKNVALCDTEDLRSNLGRLADAIKASDEERLEMFAAFRALIYDDMRAIVHPDDPLSRVQKRLI